MKAIIYTRVSTEEQTHGYSLDSQREKCINKAESLGITQHVVFEEAGVSGEVANRPALMDAIAFLKADQHVKYFICSDPDRLSRDLAYLLLFTEQISKYAELLFTDFHRETTAEGQLFYNIRGAIAQFEKELIKRRMNTGKARKAKEGEWTHWPDIYGYDYEAGEVSIQPKEAEVVQLIFKLGAKMGIRQVANRLGELGISSPRAGKTVWSASTVRRILRNESYATGVTHIRKWDTTGTHLNKYRSEEEKISRNLRPEHEWVAMSIPPIIDQALWDEAQSRLKNARRKTETWDTAEYLLSGLLRCGVCGKTWHGYSTSKTSASGVKRRTMYYVCTNRAPGPPKGSDFQKCTTGYVRAGKWEDQVWSIVKGWLEDDSDIDAFHEFQMEWKKRQSCDPKGEERAIVQHRLQELEQQEDALIERLAKETNARVRQKIGDQLDVISSEVDKMQKIWGELQKGASEVSVTAVNRRLVWEIREELKDVGIATWPQKFNAIHRLIQEVIVEQNDDRTYDLVIIPKP